MTVYLDRDAPMTAAFVGAALSGGDITRILPGHAPPSVPPRIATGYEDDEIRELAARIAALTPEQSRELGKFLSEKGVPPNA